MNPAIEANTVENMKPTIAKNRESSDSSLDFLAHVFPGSSPAMQQFHAKVQQLNLYAQRYKTAIAYVLLTGETGVGKNYTARAISAHSQWLTLTDDEKTHISSAAVGELMGCRQVLTEQGGDLVIRRPEP